MQCSAHDCLRFANLNHFHDCYLVLYHVQYGSSVWNHTAYNCTPAIGRIWPHMVMKPHVSSISPCFQGAAAGCRSAGTAVGGVLAPRGTIMALLTRVAISGHVKTALGLGLVVLLCALMTRVPRSLQSSSDTDEPASFSPFDSVELRDGSKIPLVGYGTGGRTSTDLTKRYNGVRAAIAAGMRHIDTAQRYGDEEEVGRAIRDSGVPRQSIWLTTKLDSFAANGPETVYETLASINASVARLATSYIDLVLLHSPFHSQRMVQWRALLQARDAGIVRFVGVSNHMPRHITDIKRLGLELPTVNQIELHPWLPSNEEVVAFCQAHGIAVEGYGVLGPTNRWEDPMLRAIALAHDATVPQVILTWHVQRHHIPIFGTDSPEHLQSNLHIGDFELSEAEMRQVNGLAGSDDIYSYTVSKAAANWP